MKTLDLINISGHWCCITWSQLADIVNVREPAWKRGTIHVIPSRLLLLALWRQLCVFQKNLCILNKCFAFYWISVCYHGIEYPFVIMVLPGADPGVWVRGGAWKFNKKKYYVKKNRIFFNFFLQCQKILIWDFRGGGARSPRPPLDPPMELSKVVHIV